MNEKQLFNLKQLIRDLPAGTGGLTMEELEDVQQAVNNELYAVRIKAFALMLEARMTGVDNNEDTMEAFYNTMEAFYNTQWTIQFGRHKLVVDNGATIYQGILSTLKDIIDNEL